jgi:hypothetical protein
MRNLVRIGVLALCLATPACVIHLHGDGADLLDEAIRDAAAEVNLHHAMIIGAADLDEVEAEAARHDQAMGDRLRTVRRRVDDDGCADHHGMDAMASLADQLAARHAAYVAELAAVTTVSAAHLACDRYGDDMEVMFGRMMDRWTTMDCGW